MACGYVPKGIPIDDKIRNQADMVKFGQKPLFMEFL
jgi:hypothetical protein